MDKNSCQECGKEYVVRDTTRSRLYLCDSCWEQQLLIEGEEMETRRQLNYEDIERYSRF